MLWPRKGSLMKTQTRILDYRLYYTRKIELHRKGKKSRTVRITPIVICLWQLNLSVQISMRRVHYGEMGKAPTTINKEIFFGKKQNDFFCLNVFPLMHTLPYLELVYSKNYFNLAKLFVLRLFKTETNQRDIHAGTEICHQSFGGWKVQTIDKLQTDVGYVRRCMFW